MISKKAVEYSKEVEMKKSEKETKVKRRAVVKYLLIFTTCFVVCASVFWLVFLKYNDTPGFLLGETINPLSGFNNMVEKNPRCVGDKGRHCREEMRMASMTERSEIIPILSESVRNIGNWRKEFGSNSDKSFGVGFVTVSRPLPYFLISVNSFLTSLAREDLQSVGSIVLYNVDTKHQNEDFESFRQIVTEEMGEEQTFFIFRQFKGEESFEGVKEKLSKIRKGSKGFYYKQSTDFLRLMLAVSEGDPDYLLIFEDDVIFLDRFGEISKRSKKLRKKDPAFFQLKLYYLDSIDHWKKEEVLEILGFSLILSVVLTSIHLLVWNTVKNICVQFPRKHMSVCRECEISACPLIVMFVLYSIFSLLIVIVMNKQNVIPDFLKRGVKRTYGYTFTQGSVFNRKKLGELDLVLLYEEFFDVPENQNVLPIDLFLGEVIKKHDLHVYILEPLILEHIGLKSSKM